MINVDFTTNSGETVYSYSWQNCGGNKNVNFELENPSYTWCTVTHTPENSKVKIQVDAVPLRERQGRAAIIKTKVNNEECTEKSFKVTQPGQLCGCSAFAPIEIGATFPSSGAAVGTVIGSYYDDTTCDASKIRITGDLQAEAVNGQIKLTSAVGAYNDGRTFNVGFNYNGSGCTSGTCTQSAATCRCTTISATPYTFAAPDTCGDIRPVTVLTIDGCCSIETEITGTDSDKFAITADTSGGNKVVQVCPSSQNTDTSRDRTATVSVTATCGNDTCSSSTTITQEHSGCTSSVCTCYIVSNASVVDGSNLTCESTSATVRWNFTGYTITKNADCTTAKTQVDENYQDGTVKFSANTGGETSVTRSGEIEWYDHLACLGNACGQSNVKVPWTVELPACSIITCECPTIVEVESDYLSQEGITTPLTGTVVYSAYIPVTYSADCFNSIIIEEIYSQFSGSYTLSLNRPAGTVIKNDTVCRKLDVVLKGTIQSNNNQSTKSSFFYFSIPNPENPGSYTHCGSVRTITQEGYVSCDCESIIGPDGMVQAICTNFDNSGTSGGYVLIASGHTFGCGSIRGDRGESEMLMEIKTEYEERHDDPSHPEIVTDVFCYFKGKIRSNPSGNDRSTSLFFIYIDRNGKEMTCEQSIVLYQGRDLCQCADVNGISGSYEIDSSGADNYSAITSFNVGSLTTYTIDNVWYVCQFILAESDQSWCVPYTSYNGYGVLSLSLSASTNDTGSRTANITFTNIASAKNRDLERLRVMQTYSKQYLDSQEFTYDLCGNAGVVTITQPSHTCTCDNTGFYFVSLVQGGDVITVDADLGNKELPYNPPTSACGSIESFSFVDPSTHESFTPTWATIVSSGQTSGLYKILDIRCEENQADDARTVGIKIVIKLSNGQTCDKYVTLEQESPCTCDVILDNIGGPFTALTSENQIVRQFEPMCRTIPSDYSAIITDQYGNYNPSSSPIDSVYISGTTNPNLVTITINFKPSTGDARTGYIKIKVGNSGDCSRVFKVSQVDYCDCNHLKGYITSNSSVAFGWDDTRYKTGATLNLPCNCSTVGGMVVEGKPNWLDVQVTGDTSSKYVEVAPVDYNTDYDNRSVDLQVYLTDSNGNKVDSNCYKTITVVQECKTCNCDCSQFVGSDSTYIHITASTDSDNRVLISKSSNDQSNPLTVGYILVPGNSLPLCLTYGVENSQSPNLVTYVEEDTSYLGGRYFLIKAYMVNSSPSTSTSTSTIIRIDIRTGRQCDNSQRKDIEYYFTV